MSTLIEDSSALINPEDEVRKLQDLVKKLERQNQILRSKQDNNKESESNQNVISAKISTDENISKYEVDKKGLSNTNSKVDDALNESSLDDVELLNLDSLQTLVEEDDSWLYLSPIKPTEVQRCVSPYEWARQEFEPPEGHGPPPPDTLLAQLTDVSTPARRRLPVRRHASDREASPQPVATPSAQVTTPQFNPATFTRPKQQPAELLRKSPSPQPGPGQRSRLCKSPSPQLAVGQRSQLSYKSPSPQQAAVQRSAMCKSPSPQQVTAQRSEMSKSPSPQQVTVQRSEMSKSPSPQPAAAQRSGLPCKSSSPQRVACQRSQPADSAVNCRQVELVSRETLDVHALARMQEESLRQCVTPVRKLSDGFGRRSENSFGSSSSGSSPTSSPYGSQYLHRKSLGMTSSPTSSPYGSQYLHRKSLAAEPHFGVPSLAACRIPGGGYTPPGEAVGAGRSIIPPGRQSRPTPNTISKPQATRQLRPPGASRIAGPSRRSASPLQQGAGREGARRAGRGIPRISSASRLPSPGRNLSALRKPASVTGRLDETWKDGCF